MKDYYESGSKSQTPKKPKQKSPPIQMLKGIPIIHHSCSSPTPFSIELRDSYTGKGGAR